MGTYDLTTGSAVPQWDGVGRLTVFKKVMDAADLIAANATLTANAKITAGDIINAIDIPAGFFLHYVYVKVTEAGTAGNTIDIGENTTNADGFVNGGDIATVGYFMTDDADDYGVDNEFGLLFTAADTLDVTYVADEVTGSFTVYAVGFMPY